MFERLQFTGEWRSYQQRVLDEFDHLSADERVHVVAAPGSGKTVLGLELVRRINRPALIFAPTLTVRNQWADRLVPLFLPEAPAPGFISFDLDTPSPLTMATYQSLHALFSAQDGERFTRLLDWAARQGPLTVVLDEAHHLRREWWRALDALLAALADVRVIALTATPPYDAPPAEWQRYLAANGPIDIEIGIPELVRNGDLCPHQDHILFSPPSEDLLALIEARRFAIAGIAAELRADSALADAIARHPWVTEPAAHIERILEQPELLSALLVHLAAAGRDVPSAPCKALGARPRDLPPQDGRWLECLLNGLLHDLGADSPIDSASRKALGDRLHKLSLIEGGRVRLGETRRMVRMIAGDRAKLGSIVAITRAEVAARGSGLRLVVLTDHIRAGELPRSAADAFDPVRIGGVTIFETLRRLDLPGQALGILTGTFAAVPRGAADTLSRIGRSIGVPAESLKTRAMAHCDSHVLVAGSGAQLAGVFTEMLRRGDLTMLVGTQALLGEGWDAPMVNSLVLASNSASFMLSNQMRGRAIRIDPERPDKVASIWHLATVAEPVGGDALTALRENLDWGRVAHGRSPGNDIDLLTRRFAHFAGIGNTGSRAIAVGIERLGLEEHPSVGAANAAALARAADHAGVARDWAASLGAAPPAARTRSVARSRHAPRPLVWHNTIEALALSGLTSGIAGGAHHLWATGGHDAMPLIGVGLSGAVALATLPRAAKSVWLLARNGTLENALANVAETVLSQLAQNGLLQDADRSTASVAVERDPQGGRSVLFLGVPRDVERTAIDALAQVLGPIRNPRYLLVRRSLVIPWATDYHAVPDAFARDKGAATRFAEEWRRRIGPSQLVYTRSPEGRSILLKARRASLAAGMRRRVDRFSTWR